MPALTSHTPFPLRQIHVWDLRSPSTPLQSILPDLPVLNMKANPDASCLAAVTGMNNAIGQLREV